MDVYILPTVNAVLNTTCAILLVAAYLAIRKNKVTTHRRLMTAALVTSGLFLTSYLIYHYKVGSVSFKATGWVRTVYLAILLTHTILAMVIVPLVLLTVTRAWRGRFARHKAIARWTLPLWLYVSVTGVVVYLMLYHLFPSR